MLTPDVDRLDYFLSGMKEEEEEEVEFDELVRMFDLESAERSSSWADMVSKDLSFVQGGES